jgi:hypothetical protein
MPVYTVTDVSRGNAWTSKHGNQLQDYYLTLRNEAGATRERVQLAQKPTTPPPSPGQSLELTVEADGQGRLKAKKVQPPQGARNGFSGPRPRDPKEQASIIRCHAQKVACDLVLAGAEHGNLTQVGEEFQRWVDFLCSDVEQYVQKAGQS